MGGDEKVFLERAVLVIWLMLCSNKRFLSEVLAVWEGSGRSCDALNMSVFI